MSFCSKITRPAGVGFSLVVFLVTMGACSTPHHPLEDMQQVEPATMMEAPLPDAERQKSYDPAVVQQGKYLVELLGCGTCHIDGAMMGTPDFEKGLAGSKVGIAWSNPLQHEYPGIVYPANLTSDNETGIGLWTDDEIAQIIRTGVDKQGRKHLSVMPWPAYARIKNEDAVAIVAYLRSLTPVHHKVPDNVRPGQKANMPFVHYGVYQSREK